MKFIQSMLQFLVQIYENEDFCLCSGLPSQFSLAQFLVCAHVPY